MKPVYALPTLPLSYDLETKAVLKQLSQTHRKLAELKGVARTIPNETILINTLTLQEAKDSSEIENIVTTQDDLYCAELQLTSIQSPAAAKEVLDYRTAIQKGFALVKEHKMLTNNFILQIQAALEHNRAGFRSVPGTLLKDTQGRVVYTPPQDAREVQRLMENLEAFINDDSLSDHDPLIKLAVIHHQFESIHPFYDGNGRTGRILNVLYLVLEDLLDLPILYLSRYITHHKVEYYRLIQDIRDKGADNLPEWEAWVLFMLRAVEVTAAQTLTLIQNIGALMADYKQQLRSIFGKQYRHELLNNLFFHPYTRVEYIAGEMQISRPTATRYLDRMVEAGLLEKRRIWRSTLYVNTALVDIFLSVSTTLPHHTIGQ